MRILDGNLLSSCRLCINAGVHIFRCPDKQFLMHNSNRRRYCILGDPTEFIITLFVAFQFAAVCSPQCENGGTCADYGVCRCASGWNGNHCQTRKGDVHILHRKVYFRKRPQPFNDAMMSE